MALEQRVIYSLCFSTQKKSFCGLEIESRTLPTNGKNFFYNIVKLHDRVKQCLKLRISKGQMILFIFYFFASYWVCSGWKRKKIRDWSVFTFSDLVTFGLWILTCMEGTLLWAFLSSCSSPLPVSFQFFWLILLSLKKLRIRSPAKIKMSTSMTVICSSPLYSWILPPPNKKGSASYFFNIFLTVDLFNF